MYPEKRKGYGKNREADNYKTVWNKCHDQMTQEIKKRADVSKIADVMIDTYDMPLTQGQVEKINIYAQAISTHITEGLEEDK